MAGSSLGHLSAGTALIMLAAFILHPIQVLRIVTESVRGHRKRAKQGDT